MTKHNEPDDVSTLAGDARELLAATVNVAGEKVGEARQRLNYALHSAKKGLKATDKAVHKHPYKALAIATGVGVLLGFLIAPRRAVKTEK
jgi:ElaB/YqjD/DUF883 family membrane-anchored ribosome-binding protein